MFEEGADRNGDGSKDGEGRMFYCSAEEGSGVFEVLEYIDKRVPVEMKEANQKLRKERRDKFEKLVKKMKE